MIKRLQLIVFMWKRSQGVCEKISNPASFIGWDCLLIAWFKGG
jgi:hypothetical protein